MSVRVLQGDCRDVLRTLPNNSVQCCVTSPPYFGLRSYLPSGHPDKLLEIGNEKTPAEFVATMVEVFREVRRVLRGDGTVFLNLGDSYAVQGGKGAQGKTSQRQGQKNAITQTHLKNRTPPLGLKPKDLIGIPWMVAFALRADGWWLRSDVIWAKPNPMPESVTDRPTSAHEHVFLLTKNARYFYDAEAVREGAESNRPDMATKSIRTGSAHLQQGAVASNHEKPDKQRGHGRRHAGFNDRWDKITKYEQCSMGRNLRSVWTIATQPNADWTETVHQIRVAWDAPDDGKKHIASPDCPLHGDHSVQDANVSCDERAIDSRLSSVCSENHRGSEPQSCYVPTEMPPALVISQSISDCLAPSCASSANPRNTESRRTARALATSLACMPCDETQSRTGDTSTRYERSDSADRTHANKTAPDETDDGPKSQMETGSVRISTEWALSGASEPLVCTCEHYIEKTEKTSHFATFPTTLAERCILAGTSEKGCCAACGAPWTRVTTKGEPDTAHRRASGADASGSYSGQSAKGHDAAKVQNASDVKRRILEGMREKTYSWEPTCMCSGEPEIAPCIVLDPFGGAGTVGLVADRLRRDAVLIELNADYIEIVKRRLTKDAGMFAEISA